MSFAPAKWMVLGDSTVTRELGAKVSGLNRAMGFGLRVPETWLLGDGELNFAELKEVVPAISRPIHCPCIIRTSYGSNWTRADEVSGIGRSEFVTNDDDWNRLMSEILDSNPSPHCVFIQPAIKAVCSGFIQVSDFQIMGLVARARIGLESQSIGRMAKGQKGDFTGWFLSGRTAILAREADFSILGDDDFRAIVALEELNLEDSIEIEWVFDGMQIWIVQYQSFHEDTISS